jgi:hypothetical protein
VEHMSVFIILSVGDGLPVLFYMDMLEPPPAEFGYRILRPSGSKS